MATEKEGIPFEKGYQFPTLTSKQACTKMLEPTNRSNPKFLQTQILDGNISEDSLTDSPPSVLRIAGTQARNGTTPLGTGSNPSKTFRTNTQLASFIPHPDDYPNFDTSNRGNADRGADSKLTRDISMGAFMGGNSLGSLSSDVDRYHLARNLHMQAEILKAARSRPEFNGYFIDVDEGVYKYEKLEKKTDNSIAGLASVGRAIGYKLYNFNGKENARQLFTLAEYLKDYPFYEKLIMEYNTWGGGAQARLFTVVPDMSGNISGTTFARQTETVFNGETMSASLMLLDVFPSDETVV